MFEGGGAKGIAHVGVLRALERADLELVGFAGTSAGAIVAALAAAGYSADEMFGSADSILDRLDLDLSNRAANKVNRPIGDPQTLLGRGWMGMRLAAVAHWVLFGLLALVPTLPVLLLLAGTPKWLAIISSFVPAFAVMLWVYLMSRGLASVKPVRDAINQALALKLRGERSAELVTFAELEEWGGRPLRIVAANISTGKLVLFSKQATEKVAVADAVAASICIPIVFSPWVVEGDHHFDGGLVSNLPAWTFDPERTLDRDAWTAAIEISDAEHKRPSGFSILKAAALTAVFGSSMLNTRSVERLRGLRLKVSLGLLQFDFSRSTAESIIADAEKQCERRLVAHLVDIPRAMAAVCAEISEVASSFINTSLEELGRPGLEGRLRVALFRSAADDPSSLVNEISHGFEAYADERLRLPRAETLPGLALEGGEALYASDGEWLNGLAGPVNRWARKAIAPDINWCMCVPFVDGETELVAWIDSNERLDLEDDVREVTLGELAEEISTILKQGVPKEPSEHDD